MPATPIGENREIGARLQKPTTWLLPLALAIVAMSCGQASGATLHYTPNTADPAEAAAVGFDLFDTGPGAADLNRLEPGDRALIWVGGSYGECAPETTWRRFRRIVGRLHDDPRVFGYFLYDEPDLDRCPHLQRAIRKRARLIDRRAPGQRSFVVALDYGHRDLAPRRSGVDLIGIDPYPCRIGQGHCAFRLIDRAFRKARSSGIPRSRIVPVFQTFGQTCASEIHVWRLPTAAELQSMLDRWHRLVPSPVFDFAYSWDRQRRYSCPTLADSPELQDLMRAHNEAP